MDNIILVIHLIVVVSLIFVILIQRSGQDGLSGLGGASGGSNALFSVRGKANLLTRLTSILATMFLITSLSLAYIATHKYKGSIVNTLTTESVKPAGVDAKLGTDAKTAPAKTDAVKPAEPVVPLAK
jgi:preprotein translocase subunit SecG